MEVRRTHGLAIVVCHAPAVDSMCKEQVLRATQLALELCQLQAEPTIDTKSGEMTY